MGRTTRDLWGPSGANLNSWKCQSCGFVVAIQPSRPLRFCPKCGIPIEKAASTQEKPNAPQGSRIPQGPTAEKLLQALNDEIEHIKREGGSRSYTLRNGQRIGQVAGRAVYRFDFEGERIEADVPVLLQLSDSKDKIEAEVVSVVGQEITLASKLTLPETIPKARMFADPLFILEKLRDRFVSPLQNFNTVLSEKLFAEKSPRFGQISVQTSPDLNQFQRSAVEHSLGSEVFFIWGPPGTGKTTTISSIIANAFSVEKTVLIASNTNVAVDNAISKAEEVIRQEIGYEPGDLVRFGVPQEFVPASVLPEHIVKEKTKQIDEQLAELDKELATLSNRAKELQEGLNTLEERDRLTNLAHERQTSRDDLKRKMDMLQKEVQELQAKAAKAQQMSGIGRIVRGVDVEKILVELNESNSDLAACREGYVNAERLYRQTLSYMEPIKLEVAKLSLDKAQCASLFLEVSTRINERTNRIAELQKQKLGIESQVVSNARIVATTLAKTWLKAEILARRFDMVVVDEASMATLPMLYFVAGLADERILIVGDFKQIPAIVLAHTDHAKNWLRRDIFDVAGVTNLDSSTRLCEMLRIQYRMNPDISKIVSTHIYNGLLTDHESVKRGPNVDRPPGAGYSLILIDTSSLGPWCTTRDETRSRINLIHAELAMYMAKEAIKNAFTKIGIITPYRAQARLLARRVEDENLRKKVEVATVHRFQGREKEVMIFDISDSSPYDPSRLISTKRDEEKQSEKLLNVAISRAQDKLIIIGNLEYLEKNLDKDELLLRIIADSQKNGIQLLGEQFLNFPKVPAEVKDVQDGIPSYRAGEFYPFLESDLSNAQENVVIVSAFVTARRVRKLEDTLRAAIDRGVSVTILTKPPESQFDQEEMKQSATEGIQILRNIGARIEYNPKTHEKICIIDNRIVWHGSLNILSQHKSSESMIRFIGENTARQLLADVGLKVQNVLKPESFDELRDGMRGVSTTGRVLHVEPVQFRRKSDGSTLRFAHAVLEAQGSQCNLILWEAETDIVKQGAEIRVINGYTTEYNGIISLQSGKFGKIEVLEVKKEKETVEDENVKRGAFTLKGTCRLCGKTIRGSVAEHEVKCATSRA